MRKLDVGGMERMAIDLARCVDQERYWPVFCTIEDAGRLAGVVEHAGIELHSLNKPPGLSVKCVFDLRRLIRDLDIDIVHSHNETAHFYSVLANKIQSRPVPLVHTKHGRGRPDRWRSVLRNRICALLSDIVVPVSRDIEELCCDVEGVPKTKLQTIINGVDLSPYASVVRTREAGRRFVLGHVGRLEPVKNQAMILRVFRDLQKTVRDCELVIVGDGSQRADLEGLAQDLGVDGNVRFLGYRSDIPELMTGFDCFLMSSVSEGTPLVIIEAMAAGCPIISTNVGGLEDLVSDEKNGFLVAVDDDTSMSDKLAWLAANTEVARQMGAEGRKKAVLAYSSETMIKQYQDLYERLLGNASGRWQDSVN